MLRFLPYILELALLVYCLIECIQTDSLLVRNLPKTLWVFLIIVVPIVGSIAWLVAGRPESSTRGRAVAWPSTQTAGFPEYERPRNGSPDDDPEFLAGMRASDRKHEAMLAEWEQQLREREAKLQKNGETDR
ncbi:PLD nuclease N-terminal domain-containing protein [Cellulomonas sp. URHE0023]|uniref:PLD nuclease N-terminal domain-containing protein n=1 Tax=Cellulomonas sp. URHE0023 TaxID=1380354 RepID=UPI000488B660|nr:PLD nuclease N-terminal domain-containing protein [Cellulomonas sp. URHE0023]